MKKLIILKIFILFIQGGLIAQITYENGIPTGMTITNPTGSSNSYFTVALSDNLDRAAGGLSIGLNSDLNQRFWLFHQYKANNELVRKFIIKYPETEGDLFTIQYDGNVGIGTSLLDGTHKLSVNGSIRAKEIKVETGWSDFVFDTKYELLSLDELEKYIKINKHLPDIPSEDEVLENGIYLGDMNSKLLQKIEEMTLYIIEQNRRIDLMEKELLILKKELE